MWFASRTIRRSGRQTAATWLGAGWRLWGPLGGQVRAGLELYRETAALVTDGLSAGESDLVETALAAIAEELGR